MCNSPGEEGGAGSVYNNKERDMYFHGSIQDSDPCWQCVIQHGVTMFYGTKGKLLPVFGGLATYTAAVELLEFYDKLCGSE